MATLLVKNIGTHGRTYANRAMRESDLILLCGGIWGFGVFDNGDAAKIDAAKTFIKWLIQKNVDFIFYPCVPYEREEFPDANNHYNCPIVTLTTTPFSPVFNSESLISQSQNPCP